MMRRDKNLAIILHCDTPHCHAMIETHRTSIPAACDYARRAGWAVGNDLDACKDHHSG